MDHDSCFTLHFAQAPEICALYALDVPPSTLRAKFRTQFEKNKMVKDVAVLDLMLLKGQQEYQETMNGWKQVPHIMKWFAEEEVSLNESHDCGMLLSLACGSVGWKIRSKVMYADPIIPLGPRWSGIRFHVDRHQHDPRASWISSTLLETRAVDPSALASEYTSCTCVDLSSLLEVHSNSSFQLPSLGIDVNSL